MTRPQRLAPSLVVARLVAVAAVAAVVAVAPASGLDPGRAVTQYTLRAWGTESGLPSASIQTLAQTPDGYLWIGTTEGLARFDGFAFQVFDRGNTPAFRRNEIRALYCDRQGTLWIGFNGTGVVRYRDGRFETVASDGLVVNQIAEDAARGVLLGTTSGVYTVRGDVVRPAEGALAAFAGQHAAAFAHDAAGRLWVGSIASGLLVVEGDAVRLRLDRALGRPLRGIVRLLPARDGSMTILAESGDLRWRDGEITAIGRDGSVPGLRGPTKGWIDRDGNLWLGGVEAGGLARIREGGTQAEILGVGDGLPGDRVIDLLEDREGSLWIATWDGGLARLGDGPVTTWTDREGLPARTVRTMYEDAAGVLWAGTTRGLARLDPATGRFVALAGLGAEWVYALTETADGRLLIGSAAGLFEADRERRVVQRAPWAAAEIARRRVFGLERDRAGGVWISHDDRLTRWIDGRFERFTTLRDLVFAFFEDEQGREWLGSRAGLWRRDGVGEPALVPTGPEPQQPIVTDIERDGRGDLWFGTLEGGLRVLREGRFRRLGRADGLFDDTAWALLEDGRGRLWISCAKGIWSLALDDVDAYLAGRVPRLRTRALGLDDGLRTLQAEGGNVRAGLRDRAGGLWFATMNGAARLDPARLPERSEAPPTLLQAVRVDGREVETRDVRLPAGRHRVEVDFTAVHLRAPERLRFRYRLQGIDGDWIEAGARRHADYPDVSTAARRFEVEATLDGERFGPAAVFAVSVEPFLYQRPWFLTLLGLTLATALAATWRWRVRSLLLEEARREWRQCDLQARLAFAAVRQRGGRGVPDANVVEALAALGGPAAWRRERAEDATRRLLAQGVLARDADGALGVARSLWLLLPEARAPLAEIARRSTTRVGAYALGEKLGAGGMAEVYRAENVHDHTPAAVKLLPPHEALDADARRRLEREGRLVATIDHPNVVRLYERGEHEGRIYVAMELLDGETLEERLGREGRLELDEALRIARQVAEGLAALHARDVVHRDVKPSNIMLCGARAVLLDLGLARGVESSTLTSAHAVLGTVPYLAPEILRGEPATALSDLWALGVVLHQMVTGERPWRDTGSTVELALEILRLETAPLAHTADLPSDVRAAIAHLLAPDPAARIADAATLALSLGACERALAAAGPAASPALGDRVRSAHAGAAHTPSEPPIGVASSRIPQS